MNDQPINFYLDKNSIEIMDKLESINKKFNKIINGVKNAEILLKNKQEEEKFEYIKTDVRIRK